MEKQAKRMMKFIIKKGNANGLVLFSELYSEYGKITGLSNPRMMACVRYLNKLGYISTNNIGVYPDHEAYRSAGITWEKIRNALLFNFIIPAAVSFVTAIITVAVTELFR